MICPICFNECHVNTEVHRGTHLINNRCESSVGHEFFHQNIKIILSNKESRIHHLIICHDGKNFTVGNYKGQYFFTAHRQEFAIEEFDVCQSAEILHKYMKMKAFL